MKDNNLKVSRTEIDGLIERAFAKATEYAIDQAIRAKTGIIVEENGEVVEIPYTELIEQRKASA